MPQEVNQIVSFVFDTEDSMSRSSGYLPGDLYKVAYVEETENFFVLTTVTGSWKPVNPSAKSITKVGTYTGNGTSIAIDLGFKPDFVVIKGLVAQQAATQHLGTWYNRADGFISTDSTGSALTFTAEGFIAGAALEINTNASTYYYFAYADNGSNSFIPVSWHGNATAGRVLPLPFKVKAAIIKRDSEQQAEYVFSSIAGGISATGVANTDAEILAGKLIVNNAVTTNQWSNNLGEGCNGIIFAGGDTYSGVYTGTAATQRIPLPFKPDFLLIQPLAGIGQNAHIWFSNLAADQVLACAPSASLLTGRLSSVGESDFTLPAGSTQLNGSGTQYGFFAFKQNKLIRPTLNLRQPSVKKTLALASNGYVNCGISDSLKFVGAYTLEWLGSVYPTSLTPFAGGAGVDNEAGKQYPLIFRSSGADAVAGNCSFGLALLCPRPEAVGQRGGDWNGVSVSWATQDVWHLPQTNGPILDNFPAYSGVVIDSGTLAHILLTHDGNGKYELYVNGRLVKLRDRNLVAAIGKANSFGGTGHALILGGRLRASTVDHTHAHQFKLARVYKKTFTYSEARQNFLAAYGINSPVSNYAEEWSADNYVAGIIKAKVNSENDGTVVNGTIYTAN